MELRAEQTSSSQEVGLNEEAACEVANYKNTKPCSVCLPHCNSGYVSASLLNCGLAKRDL